LARPNCAGVASDQVVPNRRNRNPGRIFPGSRGLTQRYRCVIGTLLFLLHPAPRPPSIATRYGRWFWRASRQLRRAADVTSASAFRPFHSHPLPALTMSSTLSHPNLRVAQAAFVKWIMPYPSLELRLICALLRAGDYHSTNGLWQHYNDLLQLTRYFAIRLSPCAFRFYRIIIDWAPVDGHFNKTTLNVSGITVSFPLSFNRSFLWHRMSFGSNASCWNSFIPYIPRICNVPRKNKYR
jgi:hypothetical protein